MHHFRSIYRRPPRLVYHQWFIIRRTESLSWSYYWDIQTASAGVRVSHHLSPFRQTKTPGIPWYFCCFCDLFLGGPTGCQSLDLHSLHEFPEGEEPFEALRGPGRTWVQWWAGGRCPGHLWRKCKPQPLLSVIVWKAFRFSWFDYLSGLLEYLELIYLCFLEIWIAKSFFEVDMIRFSEWQF